MISIKNILKLGLIILLLGCLLPMPYGYFQLVRFAGMALFLLFADFERNKPDNAFVIIWILCAAILNPFIKVALGRTIWNIVDLILAVLLSFSILKDRKEGEKLSDNSKISRQ